MMGYFWIESSNYTGITTSIAWLHD